MNIETIDKNCELLLFESRSQNQIQIVGNISHTFMQEYFQILKMGLVEFNSHYILEPLLISAGYHEHIYDTFVLTTLQCDDVKLSTQLCRITGEEKARERTVTKKNDYKL